MQTMPSKTGHMAARCLMTVRDSRVREIGPSDIPDTLIYDFGPLVA